MLNHALPYEGHYQIYDTYDDDQEHLKNQTYTFRDEYHNLYHLIILQYPSSAIIQ